MFYVSVCVPPGVYDDATICFSVNQEVKVSSPDYLSSDKDQAIEDFKGRISVYEEQYYPLDEELDKNLSFIKIFNQGERYLINNIHGMQAAVYLSSCASIVYLIMS